MVSQVKTETMRACLSCPLCDNILRDATTISECLHTFCRKCIYEKITEDAVGIPLEKLRSVNTWTNQLQNAVGESKRELGLESILPDHNLQDLRSKIFPLKRRKVKATENVSLPARRKERSISSLVVSTPSVSAQGGTTGRRTKAVTRKELRGNGSLSERIVKKEESSGDELLESTSSLETIHKLTQNKRQVKKSYAESFSNKENKDGDEPWDSKLDWKPLNFLVEVANRTKPALKSSASQGSGSKSEHANASHNHFQGNKKTKPKDQRSKSKREDEKSNNDDPTTSETATTKKLRKRSATNFDDLRTSLQSSESSVKRERRNGPVWFSLVASNDQEGETCLPQIPANFLRIRDGNIPVSYIQKYLKRKLDLQNETEIEIRCMGEAVIPTLKLQNLVDLWLQTSSKHQTFATSIGSSAKDYIMVLVYARKLLDCNK